MAHAEVVVEIGTRVVPLGTVGHDDRCHLGLVDDLALLQRAARRLGWSVRLCHASPELAELLDLVGLTEVLPHDGPS
jgi:anti-anti-sigma regulatory factor